MLRISKLEHKHTHTHTKHWNTHKIADLLPFLGLSVFFFFRLLPAVRYLLCFTFIELASDWIIATGIIFYGHNKQKSSSYLILNGVGTE